MARFAGYGDLHAPLWFIGMEEGGGRDVSELERRIDAWGARGRRTLEDLAKFHGAVGQSKYFAPPYPLQPTWGPLCRTLQAWRGAPLDIASIKNVQATVLGAEDGAASLLELLPLPAANTRAWPYASLGEHHPSLVDRARYAAAYTAPRIQMLRTLLDQGAPRAVVFYGLRHISSWTAIAASTLHATTIAGRQCFIGSSRRTNFLAAPHPAARGLTSKFWEDVGAHLGAEQNRPSSRRQFRMEA